MPTYEYRCTRCGHQFEAVHAVGETVARCERCRSRVRRVFSPPTLIFKGSGFYSTDNRKTPRPAEGDGGAPKTTKPATESKSSDSSTGTAAPKSSDAKKAS